MALNQSLATAYYLKEEVRQFWEQTSSFSASALLTRWIRRAETSGIRRIPRRPPPLSTAVNTLVKSLG